MVLFIAKAYSYETWKYELSSHAVVPLKIVYVSLKPKFSITQNLNSNVSAEWKFYSKYESSVEETDYTLPSPVDLIKLNLLKTKKN